MSFSTTVSSSWRRLKRLRRISKGIFSHKYFIDHVLFFHLVDNNILSLTLTSWLSQGHDYQTSHLFIANTIGMLSFVDLSGNPQHTDIAHALSTNISHANAIQPYLTATSRPNWSLSYFPGPPPASFLTSPNPALATDRYYSFWILVLIAIFGGITSVLTVLGNILVILAFFLDRQIRQPTNYFILSLSLSDFLIGLLSMPLLTIYIYAKDWPLNKTICDIWLSLDYTVCLTSIYTVLFITIDRFCSVKMPAKYRKWRTKSKINIMIAITWAEK